VGGERAAGMGGVYGGLLVPDALPYCTETKMLRADFEGTQRAHYSLITYHSATVQQCKGPRAITVTPPSEI
jgi:hypothetical protein